MAWSLAGVTIHCDDDTEDQAEPILGQIQILDDTDTTLHYAGAKSCTRSIKFWLEGDANLNTLIAATKANSDVSLVSDLGGQGDYRIMSLKPQRKQALNQVQAWFYVSADLMKR